MNRKQSAMLLLVLAVSCQSLQHAERDTGAVKHVVLCWLKTPGDQAARQRVIEESKAFVGVIPGLIDVSAGTSLPSTRPVVDASFDVAVVMTFKDEASLLAYDAHARHKKAVDEVLRPLVARLLIYDFRSR